VLSGWLAYKKSKEEEDQKNGLVLQLSSATSLWRCAGSSDAYWSSLD
jgi:hypothetical protein